MTLLFGYVGSLAPPDRVHLRQMAGGLGVLVLAVKAAEVLRSRSFSGRFVHGPIEIARLLVSITGIPAARHLPG